MALAVVVTGCSTIPSDTDLRAERFERAVVPMARAALAAGQVETARRLYTRLLDVAPDAVGPRIGLGDVALADGRPANAANWYLHAADLAATPADRHAAWLAHGRASLAAGNLDAARQSFARLVADDELVLREFAAWGHNGLAVVALLEGDPRGSVAAVERAVLLAPDERRFRDNLDRAMAVAEAYESASGAPEADEDFAGEQPPPVLLADASGVQRVLPGPADGDAPDEPDSGASSPGLSLEGDPEPEPPQPAPRVATGADAAGDAGAVADEAFEEAPYEVSERGVRLADDRVEAADTEAPPIDMVVTGPGDAPAAPEATEIPAPVADGAGETVDAGDIDVGADEGPPGTAVAVLPPKPGGPESNNAAAADKGVAGEPHSPEFLVDEPDVNELPQTVGPDAAGEPEAAGPAPAPRPERAPDAELAPPGADPGPPPREEGGLESLETATTDVDATRHANATDDLDTARDPETGPGRTDGMLVDAAAKDAYAAATTVADAPVEAPDGAAAGARRAAAAGAGASSGYSETGAAIADQPVDLVRTDAGHIDVAIAGPGEAPAVPEATHAPASVAGEAGEIAEGADVDPAGESEAAGLAPTPRMEDHPDAGLPPPTAHADARGDPDAVTKPGTGTGLEDGMVEVARADAPEPDDAPEVDDSSSGAPFARAFPADGSDAKAVSDTAGPDASREPLAAAPARALSVEGSPDAGPPLPPRSAVQQVPVRSGPPYSAHAFDAEAVAPTTAGAAHREPLPVGFVVWLDDGRYLQVGAFAVEANAKRLAERVSGLTELPVRIMAPGDELPALHRVRIGPLPPRGPLRLQQALAAAPGPI